jgi:geranylgeranylglycerol-phosphate geranylgeranyltransferase
LRRDRLQGLMQIVRPVNVLIAMVSILLAILICNPKIHLLDIVVAMLVGGLVTGGANAINDYFDLEIDRINRPERPLPRGLLSAAHAQQITWAFFLLALVLSGLLNPAALAITGFSLLLLYAYSARLKQRAVWGNLAVSLATGLAFIFGGLVAGDVRKAVMPALFAFLINCAREIIKDIEDIPGDKKFNAATLPIAYGVRTAQVATTAILGILVLLTLLPLIAHWYGWYYLIAILTLVNPLLFLVVKELWQEWSRRSLRRMSIRLKLAMVAGLVAILAGQW